MAKKKVSKENSRKLRIYPKKKRVERFPELNLVS